jgi:SAM-dependent methyltransferase
MKADLQTNSLMPAETVERARREREFFNRHSDPAEVPDHLLAVPRVLDAIPEEVGRYVPSLKKKYVCEFGCGYGVLSAYFAQRGATVFAFDVAETNVAIARRAARVNRVDDRMFLEVMQAECLAFPADTFDLVFGSAVLHHLDITLSAREIYRVLKPGGVAIFREPLGENRLLEWARRCPLRSSRHRHTADERSLRYRDVDILRTVFPQVVFRESELLAVLRSLFRKAEAGLIAVPRWERVMQGLARMDEWIFAHWPGLRPLASYSVVTMFKPAPQPAKRRARPAASPSRPANEVIERCM